jgi:hypothetical protein
VDLGIFYFSSRLLRGSKEASPKTRYIPASTVPGCRDKGLARALEHLLTESEITPKRHLNALPPPPRVNCYVDGDSFVFGDAASLGGQPRFSFW